MNFAKLAIIFASVATFAGVSGVASANEGALNAQTVFQGGKTRADVIAERQAAGGVAVSVEADQRWLQQAPSVRTRAAVIQERDAATVRGSFDTTARVVA